MPRSIPWQALACLLLLSPAAARASAVYTTTVVAAPGQALLVGLDPQCSVNDSGKVAFVGQFTASTTSYESVFITDINANPVNVGFAGTGSSTRDFSRAEINNGSWILSRERVSGSPVGYVLRRWDGLGGTGGVIVASTTSNPQFLSVTASASLNDLNQAAFIGLDTSGNTLLVTSPSAGVFNQRVLTDATPGYPQLADNGTVILRHTESGATVLRAYSFSLGSWQTLASTAAGWDSIGRGASISRDGQLVAFVGVRGAGSGNGRGLFVCVADSATGTFSAPTPIAGEPLPTPVNELGCPAYPVYFSTIDLDGKLGVIHAVGDSPRPYADAGAVAFVGTPSAASPASASIPFSGGTGLWTQTLRFLPSVVADRPQPVVQLGDTLAGGAVQGITLHEPLAWYPVTTGTGADTVTILYPRLAYCVTTSAGPRIVLSVPSSIAIPTAPAFASGGGATPDEGLRTTATPVAPADWKQYIGPWACAKVSMDWSGHCAAGNRTPCPNDVYCNSFTVMGCLVTDLANSVGVFDPTNAQNVTPLVLAQAERKAFSVTNSATHTTTVSLDINPELVRYRYTPTSPEVHLCSDAAGMTWSDLTTGLQSKCGPAAFLLAVPRRTAILTDMTGKGAHPTSRLHYIVAYDIAPATADKNHIMAKDILIMDPGGEPNGGKSYKGIAATGPLTLDDYFRSADARGKILSFPYAAPADDAVREGYIEAWFGGGAYHLKSASGTSYIPDQDSRRYIRQVGTTCDTSTCLAVEATPRANPGPAPSGTSGRDHVAAVANPVQLRVQDLVSGTTYASDASVAQAGDVVLQPAAMDVVGPNTDDDGLSISPDSAAVGWTLVLPGSVTSSQLRVSVIGADSADFRIRTIAKYDSLGTPDFSGTVYPGQTIQKDLSLCLGCGTTGVIPPSSEPGQWGLRFGMNPARGRQRITVDLRDAQRAGFAAGCTFEILDVSGRRVASAIVHSADGARFVFEWDGRTSHGADAPNGVYFVRANGRNVAPLTGHFILLR